MTIPLVANLSLNALLGNIKHEPLSIIKTPLGVVKAKSEND